MKRNVGEYLTPGNNGAWEAVRDGAESETERLEGVLQPGEQGTGVSGDRRVRGGTGTAFPEAASPGAYAGHARVFDEADLRGVGSIPASRTAG
jgi:hypothetical protein